MSKTEEGRAHKNNFDDTPPRVGTALIAIGDRARGLVENIPDLERSPDKVKKPFSGEKRDGAVVIRPEAACETFKGLGGCRFVILYGKEDSENKRRAEEIANEVLSDARKVWSAETKAGGAKGWKIATVFFLEIPMRITELTYDQIFLYNGLVEFDPDEKNTDDDNETDDDECTDDDGGADGGANDGDEGFEDDGDDAEKQSRRRHIKIKKIQNYRRWRRSENKTPYTFIGEWVNAALSFDPDSPSKPSLLELGIILALRKFLSTPDALECWPGERAISRCSNSAKTTYTRNRDSLERKGWILVERFGRGASPIIYPKIPGKRCRSKYAPKPPKQGKNDMG